MKELMEIAQDYNLYIVEDCAHSLGAEYDDKKTGSFGDFGCFSFYPTKIITTIEGGMITTNDENLARKLRVLRDHGMSKTAADRECESSIHPGTLQAVSARIIGNINDCLQHIGQAAYVRGLLKGQGWLGR